MHPPFNINRESFEDLKGNRQVCATAVGIGHNMLLADRSDDDHIIAAIQKLRTHSEALAKLT